MQSTLTSRETDPHDIFAIEPEIVLDARAEKSPSDLAHDILSRSSSPRAHMQAQVPAHLQAHSASTASAGASPPPRVDTTFRPTSVDNILGERSSSGKWAKRSFMALFALCSAIAAAGWQHYGDEAKQMIASWTPSFALSSLLQTEKPAVAEQPGSPAVQLSSQASSQASSQTATADQAAVQSVSAQPVSQTQPPATAAPVVTSADSAQLLQSMARDLATMGQQIEQLKAGIEQIKAGQEQISRSAARTAEIKPSEIRPSETRPPEPSLRPKVSALPPRPAGVPLRRPRSSYPPAQAAVAPALPPVAAAPAPVQPEPPARATAEPDGEPVVRPPMPVR